MVSTKILGLGIFLVLMVVNAFGAGRIELHSN